jgi:hypothetical protein
LVQVPHQIHSSKRAAEAERCVASEAAAQLLAGRHIVALWSSMREVEEDSAKNSVAGCRAMPLKSCGQQDVTWLAATGVVLGDALAVRCGRLDVATPASRALAS